MDQKKTNNPSAEQIGNRIKKLRLAAGLTQRELAGTTVSRNMLSMIESGNALPSVDTLLHFAEALSVTPGYFFADDNEILLYEKKDAIDTIRELLKGREYEKVVQLCKPFASSDAETRLYLALSYLHIAEAYLEKCMLVSASHYISSAAKSAVGLPYGGDGIIKICDFVTALSDCVSQDTVPEKLIQLGKVSGVSVPASFVMYLSALRSLDNGDTSAASALARSGILENFHALHIKGSVLMNSGDPEGGARILDLALSSDGGGFYSRYKLLGDLEICRKNLGDYELAYSISTSRMEMLGMFSK